MTMPHLMNCDHSEDGWCLDCVKQLWDEKQFVVEAWIKDQVFRNRQREELVDMLTRWRIDQRENPLPCDMPQ